MVAPPTVATKPAPCHAKVTAEGLLLSTRPTQRTAAAAPPVPLPADPEAPPEPAPPALAPPEPALPAVPPELELVAPAAPPVLARPPELALEPALPAAPPL